MDSHTFIATGKAGRNARTLRGTRKRPIRFQWTHFQSRSLHTNFSLVCNDLWFVARSGCSRFAAEVVGREREKKLFQKAPHDRSRHRRNGRTEKEVIGIPCILFRRIACITTVAEIEKTDLSKRDEI